MHLLHYPHVISLASITITSHYSPCQSCPSCINFARLFCITVQVKLWDSSNLRFLLRDFFQTEETNQTFRQVSHRFLKNPIVRSKYESSKEMSQSKEKFRSKIQPFRSC